MSKEDKGGSFEGGFESPGEMLEGRGKWNKPTNSAHGLFHGCKSVGRRSKNERASRIRNLR